MFEGGPTFEGGFMIPCCPTCHRNIQFPPRPAEIVENTAFWIRLAMGDDREPPEIPEAPFNRFFWLH